MNVAVTGATGFIGRHVVAALERHGVSPVLLTRTSIPSRHATVAVDVRDSTTFAALDAVAPLDVLIHLAWGGLPQYRSAHHFTVEGPAHFAFLRHVQERGLKHLVVTGTCYEYGMQSGCMDEDRETRPVTAYGFAKDVLRRQLQFLAPYTGTALTWGRLFYPYGDGQAATSLLPQLKRAVAAGATHFDMSPGDQVRDFVPVEDVAASLVSLALHGGGHGIVNICSGEPTSVRDMVRQWLDQNGWSIELNLGRFAYPEYEPMAFWGSRQKLQRALSASGVC